MGGEENCFTVSFTRELAENTRNSKLKGFVPTFFLWSTLPAGSFFRLLNFGKKKKDSVWIEQDFCWSCALVARIYNFQSCTYCRGSVMTIGLSINGCSHSKKPVWRERTRFIWLVQKFGLQQPHRFDVVQAEPFFSSSLGKTMQALLAGCLWGIS